MLESRVQFLSEDRALSSRKGLCMYVAVRGFISIGNFSPQIHPIGGKALSQYYHFIVIIIFFPSGRNGLSTENNHSFTGVDAHYKVS